MDKPLTILGRQIYFDHYLVAELHPPLAEGTTLHADFLAVLDAGSTFEEQWDEIEKRHDDECERLEDELGKAEEEASEAQEVADDAKADLNTLAALIAGFLAGPGGASADLVREHFAEWPEVIATFEGAKKDAGRTTDPRRSLRHDRRHRGNARPR